MNQRFIRIYQKFDVKEIKEHLLIFGDLSASCANCQAINIKFETVHCPECRTPFKYIAFRNIKDHIPKLQKLSQVNPTFVFVDYDDFKRTYSALKAEEFLR